MGARPAAAVSAGAARLAALAAVLPVVAVVIGAVVVVSGVVVSGVVLSGVEVSAGVVSAGAPVGGTGPVPASAAPAHARPVTTAEGTDLDERIQILDVEESASEIVLEVAVPPSIGRLAPVEANFAVTDGGQLVGLAVEPIEAPADTVIALDASGSMRGSALEAAKTAAAAFLDTLPAQARVGLLSFGDTVVTHRAPTLDRAALLADLARLEAGGDQTVLWDALVAAADLAGSADGRSAVVVLSDGDDTASAADPQEAVRRLGAGAVSLYAVAIESPDTDLAALEEAAQLAGGQFLATSDLDRLGTLYTDIAGRLANRYRLRFAPAGSGQRTVVVSVAAAGDRVATARITVGRGGAGPGTTLADPTPAGDPAGAAGGGDPSDPVDEVVLGPVTAPAPGLLAAPELRWVGLGSLFTALALVGAIVTRPSGRVRLNAAAGADRLGGMNARLGQAADRFISRHDRGGRIDSRLEAAEVNLRPGEFAVAWLVPTALAALVAWLLAGPALAPVVVAVSVVAVVVLLRVRASRLRGRFADQLTETLSIMAGSLRAGQSLPRAIELVVTEAPSPTAEQFHRIAFEVRVGRDLTESIEDAATRMASPDLLWLAKAVDINRELGGDLSEIMDNVAATIRERRTVARRIDALSAEGRATAWLLLSMPVALFLFSWWRTPDNIQLLLTEPIGRVLLGAAVTGMVLGHLWIRHLVKPRY